MSKERQKQKIVQKTKEKVRKAAPHSKKPPRVETNEEYFCSSEITNGIFPKSQE